MRANAFSNHYMPLRADAANVLLGDTLTGSIEATRCGKHNSDFLVALRRDESNFEMHLEFQQLGGGVSPGAHQADAKHDV